MSENRSVVSYLFEVVFTLIIYMVIFKITGMIVRAWKNWRMKRKLSKLDTTTA